MNHSIDLVSEVNQFYYAGPCPGSISVLLQPQDWCLCHWHYSTGLINLTVEFLLFLQVISLLETLIYSATLIALSLDRPGLNPFLEDLRRHVIEQGLLNIDNLEGK